MVEMGRRGKRFGQLLFAGAFASLLLAGCGGGAGTSSSPGASTGGQAATVELTVSAAASLTESLTELKQAYETQHPNVKLILNFGASGALQQQIEQGAPADLFLSAGKKQMDALVGKQLILEGTDRTLLKNELVVITRTDAQAPKLAALEDLTKADMVRIGIGTPESVPAGGYALEALTASKLWDPLQPKLIFTKDVKQVVTYVATGNAEAGFVYRSDAAGSKQVQAVLKVDPATYAPIVYPMGVVAASKHPEDAKQLEAFLESEQAQAVFERYGFTRGK